MKGDFTRSSFDAKKHFDRVLLQQGRVTLDADWNEQAAIQTHRLETTAKDVIGPSGAPLSDPGFEVGDPAAMGLAPANPGDFGIGAGRYYVDGILCENEAPVLYTRQPYLPGTAPLADGPYVVYLDVFKRHRTAHEDDSLREVALRGPDTASRSQVVWQVKVLPIAVHEFQEADCDRPFPPLDAATAPSTGTMAARAEPTHPETVCVLPPAAGFRRTENQLYRVEIHDAANPAAVSFKWSRENGSVAARANVVAANRLRLVQPGRDALRGFAAGDWIELTTEARELRFQPGEMVQIVGMDGPEATIDPATLPGNVLPADLAAECKVRRWDSDGLVLLSTADPLVDNGYLRLEDGVMVKFSAGAYHVGDYWEIPARTELGDVVWPKDAIGVAPLSLPPFGVIHHYARIAVVRFVGGLLDPVDPCDCRRILPPVGRLTNLFYVSGDGQEVAPDPADPGLLLLLPQRLWVGVANGGVPVEGAAVEFQVLKGAGHLEGMPFRVTVTTGPDGLASCAWELDGHTDFQEVEAHLVGCSGQPKSQLPIRFHASLSEAERVSYDPAACERLAGVKTVQEAIDRLCRECHGCCTSVGEGGDFPTLAEAVKDALGRKERCICIRLLPGVHRVDDPLEIRPDGDAATALHVEGCGLVSRVEVGDHAGIQMTRLHSVFLERFVVHLEGRSVLALADVRQARLRDVTLSATRPRSAALHLGKCEDLTVDDCRFEAEEPTPLLLLEAARACRIAASVFRGPVERDVPLVWVRSATELRLVGNVLGFGDKREKGPLPADERTYGGLLGRIGATSREDLPQLAEDFVTAIPRNVAARRAYGGTFTAEARRRGRRDPAAIRAVMGDLAMMVSARNRPKVGTWGMVFDALWSTLVRARRAQALTIEHATMLLELRANRIEGITCLYGARPARSVPPDILRKGAREKKLGDARFSGDGVVDGNVLGVFTVDESLLDVNAPSAGALLRHIAFSGNTCEQSGHVLVASHLALTGNHFDVGPEPAGGQIDVGLAFGLAAAYSTNQCTVMDPKKAVFTSAARSDQSAAYLVAANQLSIALVPW